MNWLFYKIEELPDLSLVKYQSLGESGVEAVLEKHTSFLRQWQRISIICKVEVHLYIVYEPTFSDDKRINLYLGFSYENPLIVNKLKQLMEAASLGIYYKFVEDEKVYDFLKSYNFNVKSVVKKIEREKTTEDASQLRLFSVEGWKSNKEARLYDMIHCMSSLKETAVYCVSFSGEDVRKKAVMALEKPIRYLRQRIFNKSDSLNLKSEINSKPRDIASEETLKIYEDFLSSTTTSPCFIANVKVYSNDPVSNQIILNAACSEAIEEGDCTYHMLEKGGYSVLEDKCVSYAEIVPDSLKFWPTLFLLEELTPFFRLPVLYDGEHIEIKKETMPKLKESGIHIGHTVQGYKTYLELSNLMKHCLVCGVPGAGKTNTMLRIADCLWHNEEIKFGELVKRRIPFLVLEPAKREYRELSLFDIDELIIFSPNANTRFPLQINPFEFPIGLTLSEHITRLKQVFEGAFPMQPPAPFVLDQAIESIYYKHNWKFSDINMGDKEYPTMSELYSEFEVQLLNTNYDGEIRGNIQSVLEMRIGSLIRREKKNIFDVKRSIIAPEEWLKYPIVVELEALGKEIANFVTLLLCTIIRESIKVNPMEEIEIQLNQVTGKKEVWKPLRHVIFIEEAHNLIASQSQIENNQESNPKIAATECLVDMLKEVRALREGIIIADQLPTAMAMDVVKNTNIKIVHRLTSADDRGMVGSTMSASELQMEQIATYVPGQTLMMYEGLLRPFEVKICNLENHGSETPDDSELYEVMKDKSGQKEIFKRLEARRWMLLQKKIENALKLELIHRKALREIDLSNKSDIVLEDFFDQCLKKYQALRLMKQVYIEELESMSCIYLDDKVALKTKEIVTKLGDSYSKDVELLIGKYL